LFRAQGPGAPKIACFSACYLHEYISYVA